MNNKEVIKTDKNGVVLEKFVSCVEAAKSLNMSKSQLSKKISNNRKFFSNGYYFLYTGEYSNRINFKHKKGDIINDEYGHIKILETFIDIRKNKSYKCLCFKCNSISIITEHCLEKKHQRCKVCCKNPKTVIKDKNSLSAVCPWITQFLVNPEDSYKYTKGSSKQILTKCPLCNNEKYVTINKLVQKGFNCSHCGDGVSLPNKFFRELLIKANIEFECEKKFSWSCNKRYDFYLPEHNSIVEMDGEQHFAGYMTHTMEEIKKNDVFKEQTAKNNGIETYIHVDCKKPEIDYIYNNICQNKFLCSLGLNKICLKDINAKQIGNLSLYKKIVDFRKNGLSAPDISKKLKLSKPTVVKYLKQAKALGLIEYDVKAENNKNNKKRVLDTHTGQIFESISDCARKLNTSRQTIVNNKRYIISYDNNRN